MKNLNYENHILIIGWNGNRTLQLLRLLLKEIQENNNQQPIALCVKADIENPLPDKIGFVKTSSFSSEIEMRNASIASASCIIIDNPEDDMTMTTALFCSQQNPKAHIIAYFKDEQLGSLLKSHCPNVESMPSVAVEMLAKSAMDPGSGLLHQELLDSNRGMTQFSISFDAQQATDFASLFHAFKHQYQATLIGIAKAGPETIELNPPLKNTIEPGSTLYYIAAHRIINIDWNQE